VVTLIQYFRLILGELDRSKKVERLLKTVLVIADPGLKKKNISWQIRRAIEEWQRLQQGLYDETLTNLSNDPRVQESIKRLISEPGRPKEVIVEP
jgi:hypothetical protein